MPTNLLWSLATQKAFIVLGLQVHGLSNVEGGEVLDLTASRITQGVLSLVKLSLYLHLTLKVTYYMTPSKA